MEEGAQDLPPGISKEQSESLKQFSDAQLLDELKKRLGSNPTVDPVIVQKLQTIATELQKKAEVAKQPQAEPKKPAEATPAVSPEATNIVETKESEGKKWAKIIREKGVGCLHSKFRPEWGYLQEDGKFYSLISRPNSGFTTVGMFGANNETERLLAEGYPTSQAESPIGVEYYAGVPSRANFLVPVPFGRRDDRFNEGMYFNYTAWLSPASSPDARGGVPFKLTFVLPEQEKLEFLSALKKNFDLIEEVFQNVYPGLTGEKGAKRMIVEKLRIIDPFDKKQISNSNYRDRIPEVRFSRLVGETPFTSSKGFY